MYMHGTAIAARPALCGAQARSPVERIRVASCLACGVGGWALQSRSALSMHALHACTPHDALSNASHERP